MINKKIKDFKYKKGMKVSELVENLGQVGYQGINIGKAVETIKRMKKNKAKIFLTFTSNMTSSGLRGLFAQLIKEKFVDVVITTAGSIEEDWMKSSNDFYVGSFHADDEKLAKEGINRIGNIYVTNKAYGSFEETIAPVIQKIYSEHKRLTPSEFIHEVGKHIKDENSILHQATKNNIPIYCPALTDGSFGVQLNTFQQKHSDFVIDIVKDMNKIMTEADFNDEVGLIVLGGGVSKHHALMANLINGGINYAVYITTAHEHSGSLSGATTKEAKSWGKLKSEADAVTVIGDASVFFPLIITKVLDDMNED
ncbi:deoxyhypusine synthase [Candidatus Woesearchaeota archaeon]|nr:deoxyhypusine synthase [Candidatus Woesearchaeota archaeon]